MAGPRDRDPLAMASAVGQFLGTSVSRLPFVVGVDQLLPAAFGKLHPRWAHRTFPSSLAVVPPPIVIQLGDTMRRRLPGVGLPYDESASSHTCPLAAPGRPANKL